MMSAINLFITFFIFASATHALAGSREVETCHKIAAALPSSCRVFWPGSPQYIIANSHFASTSSQHSACAVEPQNAEHLSVIVKILAFTKTRFGVKSGGHTSNPGFSSTPGVQISLARFSEIKYNDTALTVDLGSGLIWDDVYQELPETVHVVGGRVPGIGVGGFSTGGGYSWKTNQYGLTIDTVVAYNLVLPNGTLTMVSESSYPDLFWGLKGGFNNFGIVTMISLNVFPQNEVWGGLVTFTSPQIPAVSNAVASFSSNNTDVKASLIAAYNFVLGQPIISLLLFYDGVVPENGVFDDLLAIESFSQDLATRPYASFVNATTPQSTGNTRTAFNTVSLLNYTQNILDVIANQSSFWGNLLQSESSTFISYDVEPFQGAFAHATPSAYSHNTPLMPLNVYYAWTDPSRDELFLGVIKETVQVIYEAALAEGQDVSISRGKQIRYPNYALSDTPLVEMYGQNLEKLRQLRARYDKDNVMALTGGFRF